jgi:hypothetical protein
MKKKIIWFVASCFIIIALLLVSCAPATVEEEGVVVEEEEVVVEEEQVVVTPKEVELKDDLIISGSTISIETANGTRRELLAEAALKKLLAEYDVSKWIFTREILIEEGAIPHSRPILTITPRNLNDEILFFSTFLHEQIAWFLYPDRNYEVMQAVGELRRLYPEAPVGGTEEGAKDEDSNYRHLISNFLEFSAMVEVVGEELAIATMERKDHYTWVYETVLSDAVKIEEIAQKYDLIIE